MKKYIFSKYLSELSSLSHFWNVPWDSEWHFENMSSFHFLTIKNGYNRKITHKNDISQAISNFSLFHPKGPFRNVKGLMILKGILKICPFSLFNHKNAENGKITHRNNVLQAMPDLNIKRPFRIVKVLMILKGISKLFCINI